MVWKVVKSAQQVPAIVRIPTGDPTSWNSELFYLLVWYPSPHRGRFRGHSGLSGNPGRLESGRGPRPTLAVRGKIPPSE